MSTTTWFGAQIHPFVRSNIEHLICLPSKHVAKQKECGELELDALECLEAYGVRRGNKLCDKFVMDFKECMMQWIQTKRVAEMRRERIRQIMRGERKFFEAYDPIQPPRDSYQSGPFYN